MGSLLADPGYIRNAGSVELPFAGSAGLPLAEHQPPWLLKKDVLVEDGRDKDCANHTGAQTVQASSDCRKRPNKERDKRHLHGCSFRMAEAFSSCSQYSWKLVAWSWL